MSKPSSRSGSQKIILCSGGTGGHVIPLSVIAERLSSEGYTPIIVTDKRGITLQNKDLNIRTFVIRAEGIINRSFIRKVIATFKLGVGLLQSLAIVLREKPQAVIGFGAHTSLPICFAAHFLRVPMIIHEQNAVLGRANRLLSHYATTIATSFSETEGIDPSTREKISCCGNPVRKQIITSRGIAYSLPSDSSDKFKILIFGGSQGASTMDDMISQAISLLPKEELSRLEITHQTRKDSVDKVKSFYELLGVKAEISSFFVDMPYLLSQSHLIISRAGATSIAEVTAVGRPAILIPFLHAVDNHQVINASRLVENNAAWMVEEDNFSPELFAKRLSQIINNKELLLETADSAHSLGFPDATDNMMKLIDSMVLSRFKPEAEEF